MFKSARPGAGDGSLQARARPGGKVDKSSDNPLNDKRSGRFPTAREAKSYEPEASWRTHREGPRRRTARLRAPARSAARRPRFAPPERISTFAAAGAVIGPCASSTPRGRSLSGGPSPRPAARELRSGRSAAGSIPARAMHGSRTPPDPAARHRCPSLFPRTSRPGNGASGGGAVPGTFAALIRPSWIHPREPDPQCETILGRGRRRVGEPRRSAAGNRPLPTAALPSRRIGNPECDCPASGRLRVDPPGVLLQTTARSGRRDACGDPANGRRQAPSASRLAAAAEVHRGRRSRPLRRRGARKPRSGRRAPAMTGAARPRGGRGSADGASPASRDALRAWRRAAPAAHAAGGPLADGGAGCLAAHGARPGPRRRTGGTRRRTIR